MNDARETYWAQGAAIIEACLAKADACSKDAVRAFQEAPMGLPPEMATMWHEAQMNAYRHALEMMAPPSDSPSEAEITRANDMTAAFMAKASERAVGVPLQS